MRTIYDACQPRPDALLGVLRRTYPSLFPLAPAGLKVRRVAPWPAVGISWRLRLAHEPTNGRCVWPRQSGHVYYPRCYRSTAAQPW
jgi:hypothetical protein